MADMSDDKVREDAREVIDVAEVFIVFAIVNGELLSVTLSEHCTVLEGYALTQAIGVVYKEWTQRQQDSVP